MSQDLIETLPPVPKLNLMTVQGDVDDKQLVLPSSTVKAWQFHATFGPTFCKWLDASCDKFTITDPEEPKIDKGKRKRSGADPPAEAGTPQRKKQAMDPSFVVEVSAITTASLFKTKLTKPLDMVEIQSRAGDVLTLVNTSTTTEVELPACTQVAGLGSGTFKFAKKTEDRPVVSVIDAGVTIPYDLWSEGSETLVLFNNVATTIGQLVHAQQTQKPDCNLVYYNMNPEQDCPPPFFMRSMWRPPPFFRKTDSVQKHIQQNECYGY